MTRVAAVGAIIHSFLWLAGVFIVLSFPIPSSLSSACYCCCMLSIVAGGLMLSAHVMALPALCVSHTACAALCFSIRTAAAAAGQNGKTLLFFNGDVARGVSEIFLCAHACVLLLLLLQGRRVVGGLQPELAAAAA